jgi:hypothetical protein
MRLNIHINESLTYEEYVKVLDSIDMMDESLGEVLPAMFREMKNVIIQLSNNLKMDLKIVVEAFKSGDFFKLVKTLGFDMILEVLKDISRLISGPLNAAFKELYQTKAFDGFRDDKPKMKEFLDKHPALRKISKGVLTGLLIFLWMNLPFIGSFDYDFDMGEIIDAYKGKFGIEDFLASPDLVGYTVLLLFGEITGLSWMWLGGSLYNVGLAVLYTYYKRHKPELTNKITSHLRFA